MILQDLLNELGNRNNGVWDGVKIRKTNWKEGYYFLPIFTCSENRIHGLNQNGTYYSYINWEEDWCEYIKPVKMVKLYSPVVVWGKDETRPVPVRLNYQHTKEIDNWALLTNHKVLKWDEIEVPKRWEDCE